MTRTVHRCEDYIKLLEARLSFVRAFHTYVCEHDKASFTEDIETFKMDQLIRRIRAMRGVIGHDLVDELLEKADGVIEAAEALQ